MSAAPRHTILLVQVGPKASSRTYYDFESKTSAFDGVVRLFEEHLKTLNPKAVNITYDVQDLLTFLDGLGDMSCLIFDPATSKYEPYPKAYIQQQVYLHLKGLAQGPDNSQRDQRRSGRRS